MALSIPKDHVPPGMKAVHVGSPFLSTAMDELAAFGSKRVFILANKSSCKFIEGDDSKLVNQLQSKGILAAPLCTSIGMGGGEEGLLQACNDAYAADADMILTVGGGAVQDAGKFIRLWLSTKNNESISETKATVKGFKAAELQDPMPKSVPQIAIPNSFAMAEATHVAGLTTTTGIKSGAKHPSMMPTVIIYDPAMSAGLPEWVRFGTALRGVEHAVGAVTHPKATDEVRTRALQGLAIINDNIKKLASNPECATTQCNLYVGGFIAVRALNMGCYPTIGHLVQNQYSARFNVHQGSCSGILCARIMDYHYEKSMEYQKLISQALGDENTPAPKLVRDLVSKLPAVSNEHSQVNVSDEMLQELTKWMSENHLDRYNLLCPKEFTCAEDIYGMMTKPLAEL